MGACDDESDGIVLLSKSRDQQIGQQVAHDVDSIYNVLEPSQHPRLYELLTDSIWNPILNSEDLANADDERFAWQIRIIDDSVLNAFAAPAGYVYVYTGLIDYLDKADDLAGVLAHEAAHAGERHTMKQLQVQYGASLIVSMALGEDAGQLTQIATNLALGLGGLAYSRNMEADADEHSITYLDETKFMCNGAAQFFEKLSSQGSGSSGPAWLSTHPSPDNRVEDINNQAQESGCNTTAANPDWYQEMKNLLPHNQNN